jgi:hypothetical protein
MKIRCKVCGEFFSPDDDTVELASVGYIDSATADTCDDCWDMLNHIYDDIEDMINDADPGL